MLTPKFVEDVMDRAEAHAVKTALASPYPEAVAGALSTHINEVGHLLFSQLPATAEPMLTFGRLHRAGTLTSAPIWELLANV